MSNINNNVPKFKRYWPPPPLIDRVYEYQNLNKDAKFRKEVTEFFKNKIIKWIDNDKEFSKYNSKKKYYETENGFMEVYNLLRKYARKHNLKWWDLRSDHYSNIKEYMSEKL